MVPCPWFPAAAELCRAHPTVDMGVHLTLNAEWSTYRWGPVGDRNPATGLLDQDGYFHATTEAAVAGGDPAAVAVELAAQVARAAAAGIDITHVDSHMGTVLAAPFLPAYIATARTARLPFFFPAPTAASERRAGLPPAQVAALVEQGGQLAAAGVPLFDALVALPLDDPTDHVAVARKLIDDLQPGLTVLLLHPAQDTPELRALAPDWRCRVANYQALCSPDLRAHIRQAGVQIIGYRPLRDLVRTTGTAPG
jgi:predicted glycoside hydrolase/deacetylase ChbG (UPF0249 family)